MDAGKIWVQLGLDDKEFKNGIKQTEAYLGAMGKKMQNTGMKLSAMLTLPILAAGGAAFKYASDLSESMNKSSEAFKDSAGVVQDWSKTTLTQLGLSQGAALDAVSLFGDMATSMGLVPEAAADMSMSLVALGADLASFKNISIDQAGNALKGIFTGETESLKTLGIVMTANQLETFALANGYNKLMKNMTQAELIQLRYNYVMSVTTNAQGDFLRTSDGASNQMRIFTESIKEAAASFGQILLPIITPMIQKVNALMAKIATLSEEQKKWIIGLAGIAAAIGPVLLILGKFLTVLPQLNSALNVVMKSAKGLQTLMVANPYIAVAAAIGLVVAALLLWRNSSNELEGTQKRINDSMAKATAQIKLEQNEMNNLFKEIKNTNTGTEQRKKLIERLNTTYGQYLPFLITEKTSLQDIEIAQKNANTQLANNILLKAKEATLNSELSALYEKQAKLLQKIQAKVPTIDLAKFTAQLKNAKDYYAAQTAFSNATGGAWVSSFGGMETAIKSLMDTFVQEQQIVDMVGASFDAMISSAGGLVNAAIGGLDLTKTGTITGEVTNMGAYEALNKQIQEIKDNITEINTLVNQGKSIPLDFDLTAAMTELSQLEAMKAQIDTFFSGALEETKKTIEGNLAEMRKTRETYGLDETALLEKQQMEQYALLAAAKARELQLYDGNAAKETEILDYYKSLQAQILDEYAVVYGRINEEKSAEVIKTLSAEIQAIENGMLTQNQIIQKAWEDRVAIIDKGVELGILSIEKANEMIKKLSAETDAVLNETAKGVKSWGESWKEAGTQMQDALESMVEDTVTSAVDMLASGKDMAAVGLMIMSAFADMAIQVGKIAVGTAIAVGGIKEALQSLNPYVAAAAGIALIALGGFVKSQLSSMGDTQGLATGGIVTSGGVFKVGEEGEELVSLPRGSAVTPNHMLNGAQGGYIASTRISGRDLEILIERAAAQTKRR